MKKFILPAALLSAVMLSAWAGSPKDTDPVVMNINGKDIHRSEFEYLYNKNNRQQAEPQSMADYVDMFVVYKLKVAEAEAAGLDTTATFVSEFDQYCADITTPYLVDSLVTDRLMNESYQRMHTIRDVSHIMVPMGGTASQREYFKHRIDSIHDVIVNKGGNFEELARQYSADRNSAVNGGRMGEIVVNRLPYPFEKAAYDTPVGGISAVIEDVPYGWHIIKVNGERPYPGRVTARHILKLTQGLSPEEAAVKKAEIDSLHALILAGKHLAVLALSESEDPGTAQKGGLIGPFGPGQMVPEFEQTAFSLPAGGISEPFQTAYGWHIVETVSHDPFPELKEVKGSILMSMARDMRATMPRQARLEELRGRWGFNVDSLKLNEVETALRPIEDPEKAFGTLDGNIVLATVPDGKTITVKDVLHDIPANSRTDARYPWGTFERSFKQLLENATVTFARTELVKEHPEYRNLVNEYRDGILLFDISNRKVWEPASKDAHLLQTYFAANRDKYTWDKPHFKGSVIFTTNDSVRNAVQAYLAANTIERDSLVGVLQGQFGNTVKVERVTVAKGDHGIVDQLAFGGEPAKPVGRWTEWFAYDWKVLDAPEEASDVKAAVASDLQAQLEADWVKDLRKRYKVKFNKKQLKELTK